MQIKKCGQCGKKFKASGNYKYCGEACVKRHRSGWMRYYKKRDNNKFQEVDQAVSSQTREKISLDQANRIIDFIARTA